MLRFPIARFVLFVHFAAGCGGAAHTSGDAAPVATTVVQQTAPAAAVLVAQDVPSGGDAQIALKRDPVDVPKSQRQIIYDAQVRLVVEDFEGIAETVVAASQNLVVAGVVVGPRFGVFGIPALSIFAVVRRRIAATRHLAAHRG